MIRIADYELLQTGRVRRCTCGCECGRDVNTAKTLLRWLPRKRVNPLPIGPVREANFQPEATHLRGNIAGRAVGADRGIAIPLMSSTGKPYDLLPQQRERIEKKQIAAKRWQRLQRCPGRRSIDFRSQAGPWLQTPIVAYRHEYNVKQHISVTHNKKSMTKIGYQTHQPVMSADLNPAADQRKRTTRRAFLATAGISLFMPAFQLRANTTEPLPEPFSRIGPIKEDAKTVYEFMLFSCQYCQRYHDAMASWGRTLPHPYQFETSPVVFDQATAGEAFWYYAAKQADPLRAELMLGIALQEVAAGGGVLGNYDLLDKAGIDRAVFKRAAESERVKQSLIAATVRTRRYQITNTPSLGITGRYVVHAEHTSGDYGLLMKMASGLVSRSIEGGG